ncbi:MAG: CvpA family protein [Acidobacteria bacterium]|nr:CvpA family protein [Acidobacteriota bacterium]
MIGWLDIVLAVIIIAAVVIGLIKGLLRELIGLAAVVGGFILAAYHYQKAADLLGGLVRGPLAARFLGFLLIFVLVVLAGALVTFLVSKLMKGTLRVLDHLMGGVFGCLEGILIGGVLFFALLVFPVDRTAVSESRLAPYCYGLTKAAAALIPAELKNAARSAYQRIFKTEKSHGQEI